VKGAPGRGTLEKEKPPVFRRTQWGGQVVIRMLADVNQKTIAPETAVFSNEFDSYARLPQSGYAHDTVCHAAREFARDDYGDGFCEVHVNTPEGFWSLLRNILHPHRGSRRSGCRCTWGFSSSCITPGGGVRPCRSRWSASWLHSGIPDEPHGSEETCAGRRRAAAERTDWRLRSCSFTCPGSLPGGVRKPVLSPDTPHPDNGFSPRSRSLGLGEGLSGRVPARVMLRASGPLLSLERTRSVASLKSKGRSQVDR
jgi:hypothetical protein